MAEITTNKILDYLLKKNEVSGKELSLVLGITDRAVRKQLKKLFDAGKIYKIGKPPRVYYSICKTDAEADFGSSLFIEASRWITCENGIEPDTRYYCPTSAAFLAKLTEFQKRLEEIEGLKDVYPVVVAAAGEIGDNSFAHNIGNWPDIPGIFFGYDAVSYEIVLADRGRGILRTLSRVRPDLKNDADALRVAFTEIISGRAPEERGNGLKFVRKIISGNHMRLFFKTGNAELKMKKEDEGLNIKKGSSSVRGCIARIRF